jgi:hypothetical protein
MGSFAVLLRPMEEGHPMSTTDVPADFANQSAEEIVAAKSPTGQWAEIALTVIFTTTAIMFVSFVAVVTGLV